MLFLANWTGGSMHKLQRIWYCSNPMVLESTYTTLAVLRGFQSDSQGTMWCFGEMSFQAGPANSKACVVISVLSLSSQSILYLESDIPKFKFTSRIICRYQRVQLKLWNSWDNCSIYLPWALLPLTNGANNNSNWKIDIL